MTVGAIVTNRYVAVYMPPSGVGPADFDVLPHAKTAVEALRDAQARVPNRWYIRRIYDKTMPGQPTVWIFYKGFLEVPNGSQ